MMSNGSIQDKLSELSALGDGIVPGVPLIEVIADKRVLIENHRGICKYTHENICIYSKCGMIRICGQKLFLKKMTKDQLTITGQINGVLLCRGGNYGD